MFQPEKPFRPPLKVFWQNHPQRHCPAGHLLRRDLGQMAQLGGALADATHKYVSAGHPKYVDPPRHTSHILQRVSERTPAQLAPAGVIPTPLARPQQCH